MRANGATTDAGRSATRSPVPIPKRCWQRAGGRARRTPRSAQDLSRLRLGRRKVIPDVRRRTPAPRSRRGRRRGRDAAAMDPEVEEIVAALETIPTATSDGAPVIDVAAILARHPQVCLVDGLAYDNPPGSRHREALSGRRRAARGRHLRAHVAQPGIHRRAAGFRRGGDRPATARDRAAGVRRTGRRGRHRRRAAGRVGTGAASEQLSQLRQRALLLTADVVDRPARSVPSAAWHRAHVGHAGADSGRA